MGTLTIGSFGNDTALDWLAEIEDSDGSAVRQALEAVLSTSPSDPEAEERALAAAEVVATACGHPLKSIPPQLAEWLAYTNNRQQSTKLRKLAQQVIQRIRADSSLKRSWRETPSYGAWMAATGRLQARLKAVPKSAQVPTPSPKRTPKKLSHSPVKELGPGVYSLRLPECTVAALQYVIRPEVPYVWIFRHHLTGWPWWEAELPLRKDGPTHRLLVRGVQYDCLFPTHEFLELLPEFSDRSIVALQTDRPIDTYFFYDNLPDDPKDPARYTALRAAGWRMEFVLGMSPNPASVTSPDRDYLEFLAKRPELAPGVIP